MKLSEMSTRFPDPRPRVLPLIALPIPTKLECYIKHGGRECDCTAPRIVNTQMAETAEASGLYILSALQRKNSKLSAHDLDYLARKCAEIAGHWANLALGPVEEKPVTIWDWDALYP